MTSRGRARIPAALALVLALLSGGCDRMLNGVGHATPRDRYAETLRAAGLEETSLFRQWIAAGAEALDSVPEFDAPFRESGYFAPDRPAARAYRIPVRRGQRFLASFSFRGADAGTLFADLFEIPADSSSLPRRVASADSGSSSVGTEVTHDGELILRLQPELLRGGRYSVAVRLSPTLEFPVTGLDMDAVQSRFGAERDAGRRSHEGIDIFAPRGTPVVAAASGTATRVGTNRLGGNIVMVRSEATGERHYYAHLDTQLVAARASVERGDTIGLVGNTGNARTTPPHLHFGIYGSGVGAVDPYPYVVPADTAAPELAVREERFGGWARVVARGSALFDAPGGDELEALPARTLVRVTAGTGAWYRVQLPDGREGFVRGAGTEAPTPLAAVSAGSVLRERPDSSSVVVDTIRAGVRAESLGRFGAFDLARTTAGTAGWVPR